MRANDSGLCSGRFYREEWLEDAFLTEFERKILQPTGFAELLRDQEADELRKRSDMETARRRMQNRIKEIEQALQTLDRNYYELNRLSDDEYWQRKTAWQTERQGILEELAIPLPAISTRDYSGLIELAKNIRVAWRKLEPTERKMFLLSLSDSYCMKIKVKRCEGRAGGVVVNLEVEQEGADSAQPAQA